MPDEEAGTSGSPSGDSAGSTGAGSDAGELSDWTREWLEARAEEQGVPPGELLKRFAAAFRAAEEGEIPDLVFREDIDPLDEELDALESDLDALESVVDDLEADVAAKIQDVRERVIQVKRETDEKAPADHDHPELADRTASAAQAAQAAQADVEALEATVSEGFENFEEILEYLTNAVDDVEEKNTRLARAIVSMRETVEGVTARESRRIAADRLREQANTHGIRSADCDDCGATLDIALLTDARCPHCASTFASVQPKRGFFGSPTLEVGDRPALEAADVERHGDLESIDTGAVADGNGISTNLTDIASGETAPEKPDDDITPGDATEEDDQ